MSPSNSYLGSIWEPLLCRIVQPDLHLLLTALSNPAGDERSRCQGENMLTVGKEAEGLQSHYIAMQMTGQQSHN